MSSTGISVCVNWANSNNINDIEAIKGIPKPMSLRWSKHHRPKIGARVQLAPQITQANLGDIGK